MERESVKCLLNQCQVGASVTAAGWVRTRRDSKAGCSFIELNDGSCFANLQVVADSELANYQTEVKQLFPGSAIRVVGALVASPGSGQRVELHAEKIHVYGYCDPKEYPLQKQRVSFERLREIAHLRARTNTFGAVTRVRNALAYATHRFFQDRAFYYINTPIITANDCEGAGEQFRVTTMDPAAPPLDAQGKVDYGQDFFARRTHLTVSGQLEGEAYACALGKIYTFGPTFRAENSNTSRHLSEFWMVEPEMAFADLDDDCSLAEQYLRELLTCVLTDCSEDLAFFNKRIDSTLIETLTQITENAFVRLSYTDAVTELQKATKDFEFPVSWGVDLQSEHERYLTEEIFKCPVIITDFPKDIKAFYMRLNEDGRTVAAMDVLLPKIGEIIGGSQREERLEVIEGRIREGGLEPSDYEWFLDLRRFGTVPHAGFGLGFERLVQFATAMGNIRDVIPFPRTPRNAEF